MKEENLIFIVSQPRAGSTFLQNLLSNNNSVNTCSEPWILLNFANQIKPDLLEAVFGNKLANDAFIEYKKKYSDFDFKQEQKEYLLSLYTPMINGFDFVIDKTPRYWELLDEIVELFPKSKIIVLKRNPLDVARSMMKTWNLNTIEKLTVFRRDLLLAPKKLQEFCEQYKENPNVYTLRYEDLVTDISSQTQSLYQWLGVSFTKKVLDTSSNEKYKGKYGDPYQNTTESYLEEKKKSNFKLSKNLLSFLEGYKNNLGIDFLKEYGNYSKNSPPKKTKAFSYYMYLTSKRKNKYIYKNEIKYFLKEVYFKFILKLK